MEMLLEHAPDNLTLRTFGCAAYVHKQKRHQTQNLDILAEMGIGLGIK